MGCKEGDDANGYSLRQEPDTADRPHSQCPCGLRQNGAKRSFEERPKQALAALRSLASQNNCCHDTVRKAAGAGMAAGGYSRKRPAMPVTCRSRYRHRAPCDRHRLTVREAQVRRRCYLAAPASGCRAVTCRGEYPVFISNAVHGGPDQRFPRAGLLPPRFFPA
jgi:hypothetical protein